MNTVTLINRSINVEIFVLSLSLSLSMYDYWPTYVMQVER